MKSSWDLEITSQDQQYYLNGDRYEIDHPDPRNRVRLHYLDRMSSPFRAVRRFFPESTSIKVADLGCAQGNLSLRLAELGYQVTAVEQDPAALNYIRLKQQSGALELKPGNLMNVDLPPNHFDVVILAEVIEHSAWPERMLIRALELVRPGGYLIVTTPNGARVSVPLQTWTVLQSQPKRDEIEKRQFGDDHLWKLLPDETKMLLPAESAELQYVEYCGSTVLINRWTEPCLSLLPLSWIERFIDFLLSVPLVNRWTFNTLCATFRKSR
jgi:2-polyprenyl-6-hydroxyphenyl methylase/3-demethylubiquinone-9 3-methyltransferase